jgi:hypothetical protein
MLCAKPRPRLRWRVRQVPEEKNATELPQRTGQKIFGPGVPKCRLRFFRYVLLLIVGVIEYVARRCEEIVEKAFVSNGNEENKYGEAVVPRATLFRSPSQDVLQATIRCNADYQYQKKAVLEPIATEHDPATSAETATGGSDQPTFIQHLFYGCGKLPLAGEMILTTFASAMRAADIADFYVTKYQSKTQEALGPTIQPLIAGVRWQEESESTPEAKDMFLAQRATKDTPADLQRQPRALAVCLRVLRVS